MNHHVPQRHNERFGLSELVDDGVVIGDRLREA